MSLSFFLEQPSYLRGVIADYLKERFPDSFWETFLRSPRGVVFESVILSMVVFALVLRLGPSSASLIALAFAIFVGYMWFLKGNLYADLENKHDDIKVKRLERTMQRKRNIFDESARSILHKNPALVKVFSSLYVFARFDKRNFRAALIHANQLIRIYESSKIGIVLPAQTIDVAERQMRNCMNSVHAMIHSLPSTTVGDFRYQVSLNILQKVLQKIIDDIKLIADSQYHKLGPDIYNPPPSTRAGPWPNPLKEKDYNKYYEQYY
jgi:hypothetical protein